MRVPYNIFRVVVFLLLLPGGVIAEQIDPPDIKIGAIYGFSGFANVWSAQARRGIKLATEEINGAGGINGRKIRIIFEDSQSKPASAVSAFNKLVKIDEVDAVVGDIISFLTLPLAPLAKRHKVLLVTPSIFDIHMPDDNDYFFTTCPSKASIQKPVEQFFIKNADIRSVAILCAENSWGHAYRDVWEAAAQKHRVEVVETICTDEWQTDFRSELTRIRAKEPDSVIIAFGVDRALRRMKEIGFEAKVLTTTDIVEAVYRRQFPISEAAGVYFNDWPASESFARRFSEKFGEPPIMEPQNSYEAIRAVARAFERNPSNPAQGLRSLRYQGAGGQIDFVLSNAGNQAKAKLFQADGRKFVLVR